MLDERNRKRDHNIGGGSAMEDSFEQSLSNFDRPSAGQSSEVLAFATDFMPPDKEVQELVDFVPQVLAEFDANGRWIHANRTAREYTGLTLDEYRTTGVVAKLIHPADAERMRSIRERGFASKTPFEVEGRLFGKECGYRWFLFRYRPMFHQGQVQKWYGSATEIEARKQEEERVGAELLRLVERTQLAEERHDALLQRFALASLQISEAVADLPSNSSARKQLNKVLQLLKQGMEEGRSATLGLRSTEPMPLDSLSSLSRVQHEFVVQSTLTFRLVIVGNERPLIERVGKEIYRIGREALVNAFRHSGATWIEVMVEYAESNLRMRIQDNGCGIDPGVLTSRREGHCGLPGMRERATKIGGSLDILSRPTGTEVYLLIPCEVAFQATGIDSTPACEPRSFLKR